MVRQAGRAILGLVAAGGLFATAAVLLPGTSRPVAAHLALAALAGLALLLSARLPAPRAALAAFGLGLSVLTFASAAVFPALLRAEAARQAAGRPFCLAGPEVGLDPDAPRRAPYSLNAAPAGQWALSFLALPRPLTLVVALPPEDPPPGKTPPAPDAVFAAFDWNSTARRFQAIDGAWLREGGDSRLLDCIPQPNPFAPDLPAGPAALVIWRDPAPAASPSPSPSPAWGPRRSATLRLPEAAAPQHHGRFRSATIDTTLALFPDAGPVPLILAWVPDPALWLDKRRAERVRDRDAPLDWSSLPVTDAGLTAYEVPSTSVAGAIDGTYLRPGPDGAPLTVIACDPFFCRHHLRPDPALPVVVSLTYPLALLPRWREAEEAARREAATAIGTDAAAP